MVKELKLIGLTFGLWCHLYIRNPTFAQKDKLNNLNTIDLMLKGEYYVYIFNMK